MKGPKFYSIDFTREIVLQGKSNAFLTISRNDDELNQDETLYIVAYPSTNTFNSYASVTGNGGNISSEPNAIDNVNLTGQFPENNKLGFNNAKPGHIIKNGHEFMPYGPDNIGPVIVKDVNKTYADPAYTVNLSTDASLINKDNIPPGPPNALNQDVIHIGEWEVDNDLHWYINGKNLSQYKKIALSDPPSRQRTVTYPNLFDGTLKEFNLNILEGTGYVGRESAGWAELYYDNWVPNKSITFRIDFDGEIDSHLKLNFLIFKIGEAEKNVSLIFGDLGPLIVPQSHIGPFNPPGESYVLPPYGIKSEKIIDNQSFISNNIDYQELHIFGYTETNARSNRDAWQNEYVFEKPIYDDKSSYGLLKTNPKLSGNIKLTVDSSENLWLNSIDANNELSDSSYKKYSISSRSTYAKDLYSFFKNGKTPASIIFDLYQFDSTYQNTKRELNQQYDNFYNYGVEQLRNKFYDENFSFFAPLWLRKKIPDYFIIFRIDHPISIESYQSVLREDFFNKYFKEAKIIKTYDMRPQSKLGAYLSNIVNDSRFKERPINVSFDSDELTLWNGISYADGSMTGKGEFLNEYWKVDRPIIELEEYITAGFERNGIISTNLINLEFLFDDEEAELYGINRYFGLYVSENELGKIQIDPRALLKMDYQTPTPKPGVDGEPYSTKDFIQSNPSGIEIPVNYYHNRLNEENTSNIPANTGDVIGKLPLSSHIDDSLRVFYIKDRENGFKRINQLKEVDYGNPGTSDYFRSTHLRLFDNQENISNYAGVNEITSQFVSTLLDKGNSQLRLHLFSHDTDDVIADEEELVLTLNQYNYTERLHTYYVKVKNSTANSVSFEIFKDQYTEKLINGFTMPAAGAYVNNFKVNDITRFTVGQTIYITAAGYFKIIEVNETDFELKLQNINNPINEIPLTAINDYELISINGPTFNITYDYTPLTNEITVDSLLTLILLNPTSNYISENSYLVSVKNAEKIIKELNENSTDLDIKITIPYTQFKWRMIANELGLLKRNSWAYPVEDPDAYEYITTFNNKGLASDVAQSIAKAINSFENRPCNAYVENNIIYLKANNAGNEGESLELSRKMIHGKSNINNIGFYRNANVKVDYRIEQLKYDNIVYQDIETKLVNFPQKAGTEYYYVYIKKSSTSTLIKIRKGVDPTSIETAKLSGISKTLIINENLAVDEFMPFSINTINIEENTESEYVISVSVSDITKQLFIGNSEFNRNRAKINFTDSQRYFQNRIFKVQGRLTEGSDIIDNILLDNLLIGSRIAGDGLQNETYIINIDYYTKEITISKPATKSGNTVTLTADEVLILNDTEIKTQWYQAQKGFYSLMKGWNVQGKYIYSLPNLEEPVYDIKNKLIGYNNLGEYSIIQLEKPNYEFYQKKDLRIVAYDIYRPSVGVFSIYPLKNFDFDFYFSDYSYTPVLEALRYYFNERVKINEPLILPVDENYRLIPYTENDEIFTGNLAYTLDIEGYNNIQKTWDKIETIGYNGFQSGSKQNNLLINTYYPFYVYDENENPVIWDSSDTTFTEGMGLRNYMKRSISIRNDKGEISEHKPLFYRISLKNVFGGPIAYLKVVKNDYSVDIDIKEFTGFSSISDIFTQEDSLQIRQLLDNEQYIEAFLRQILRTEYDRLRENNNKEYATKSKVVPYINKWSQEGTDARDNYYRLSTSTAFGLTNLSPDIRINKSDPSLLTHEFPYLESVPKDYPVESLEGSRSYMFSKLSDIAANNQSWLTLLSTDLSNDWFTKYFSVGYPTEKNIYGDSVGKSREERFTFFKYTEGIERSQTLFRGGKIQVIDLDPIFKTEIASSTKYNDYKFSAIARIIPPEPFVKEAPVKIEIIRNDKYKSILMIINAYIKDYRVQSGLTDYFFLYTANNQLQNSSQKQIEFKPKLTGVTNYQYGGHSVLNITDFLPYSSITGIDDYLDMSMLRTRQGFFGGGVTELGNTKLAGIIVETNDDNNTEPSFSNGIISLTFEPISPFYDFSVSEDIIPTYDIYKSNVNMYSPFNDETGQNFGILNIIPLSNSSDGSFYKFLTYVKTNVNIYKQIERINSKEVSESYLPYELKFGSTNKPIFSSIRKTGVAANALNQFKIKSDNDLITENISDIFETYVLHGGTNALLNVKKNITYAGIANFINQTEFVKYYSVNEGIKEEAHDFKLQCINPDLIVKTGMLAYTNDEDKPIEYIGSPVIGYNIVNTNQNEVIWRHRGIYEPLSKDILSFWVREDESFTKHFEKDFLLRNTHINNMSSYAGIIRNYGINKVSDVEILKIKGGGAYTSSYPLINEIAIDKKDQFILNSTWDKNYYQKYFTLNSWDNINGIKEMKEFKSFMGSKAMNTPKSQVLDTFNQNTELIYEIINPSLLVGVSALSKKEPDFLFTLADQKPVLEITLDLEKRLLRKLIEDIESGNYVDEFARLTTLGIYDLEDPNLSESDIANMKIQYLTKNILNLYEIDEINLYKISREGFEIIDTEITDDEKISLGYRKDKDCLVTKISDFKVKITKTLDTKQYSGYAITAVMKRI